ncbi:MAG: hypothetical protein OQL19_03195 [Gammaproteobacteria bacterium]|nr:hypothetical protein [Gammaproteobacteria bacterium]
MNKTKLSTYTLFLFFILITVSLYWPGLYGPFLFDDFPHIVYNPALQFNNINIDSFFQAVLGLDIGPIGRPLSNLSFALNSLVSGTQSAFYFKLTNLFIHLLNGLILFLLINKISFYLLSCQHKEKAYALYIALFTAGFWLIHPFNLSTVLYVVQRMNGLATLFILLTLLNYIFIRENFNGWSLSKKILSFSSLISFFLLGMLSKENAILVIFYIFLIESFCFKFDFENFKFFNFSNEQLKKAYYFLIAFTTTCFIALLIKFSLNYSFREFSLTERLMTETRIILFYIRLILVPDITQMGLFHDDFIISTSFFNPISTLLSSLLLIGSVAIIIIVRRRLPVLSFGLAFFLLSHTLESTIIPLELVHEHRNYFSSFSLIFILVFYLITSNIKSTLKISLIILLTASLSILTLTRSHAWGEPQRLATWLTQHHPQSTRSLLTAATMQLESTKPSEQEQGLILMDKAYNLSPEKIITTVALINTLYIMDIPVPDELLEQLMKNGKEGFLTPGDNAIIQSPAKQCDTQNQCLWPDDIYEQFLHNVLKNATLRKTAECRIYTNLAAIKSRHEDLDSAIIYAGKALECDPDSAQNHLNYANLLIYKGDLNTSVQHILIAKMLDKSEQNQQRVENNLKIIQNLSK